ncbi:hypothetical protein AC564_3221c [Lacticaseibacillus paracasei]|nr:hypothetical protein AC564_3221c [Lacticaseibacillus paracasei]
MRFTQIVPTLICMMSGRWPSELRKAHQSNDQAVMRAYGMDVATTTESDSVAKLFTLYAHLVK